MGDCLKQPRKGTSIHHSRAWSLDLMPDAGKGGKAQHPTKQELLRSSSEQHEC